MLPSLWPRDLLVTVPATWLRLRPGDVVVAEVEGRRVTKRLAGPPGARVDLRDGHLLVDGDWWAVPDVVHVDEDAGWHPGRDGAVLLGDHRARSTDTRGHGWVAATAIDRIALARVRPWAWLRGRARRLGEERTRPGVRLVVLDPDDRVLLFRVRDVDGSGDTWWEAPGGGRHQGEPARAAATRELAEEVGTTPRAMEALGEVHVRHTTLGGARLHKVEDVFAVRVATSTVDDRGWTAAEVRDIQEHRWCTIDELGTLDRAVVPPDLPRLARLASTRV